MPKNDKSLPKPPSTPFGRKKSFGDQEAGDSLMADEMAMAMSEGKLEEFVQRELPDSEHARKLAEMMMGMTGMMPAEGLTGMSGSGKQNAPDTSDPGKSDDTLQTEAPEEVVSAVQSGDVQGLMDLLKREHRKRHGDDAAPEEPEQKPAESGSKATIEKDTLEQMIKIASDNSLSLDWIFFRALKRYVEEYKKTGSL